jgi:hypothetical protein
MHMKRIGLLTMAFLLAPVAGFAQDAPPAGPPPPMAAGAPNPQRFAEMRQDREQMEQLHKQARAQMLAAISPAHRALLANIIGQLAIAPNPDPRAAALQLDAALSGGEKQSILNVEAQMHAQMKTMMEAARARMESSMSADQRSAMDARMAKREDRPHSERTPDAGRALLGMAIHAGGPGGPEGMRPPR